MHGGLLDQLLLSATGVLYVICLSVELSLLLVGWDLSLVSQRIFQFAVLDIFWGALQWGVSVCLRQVCIAKDTSGRNSYPTKHLSACSDGAPGIRTLATDAGLTPCSCWTAGSVLPDNTWCWGTLAAKSIYLEMIQRCAQENVGHVIWVLLGMLQARCAILCTKC